MESAEFLRRTQLNEMPWPEVWEKATFANLHHWVSEEPYYHGAIIFGVALGAFALVKRQLQGYRSKLVSQAKSENLHGQRKARNEMMSALGPPAISLAQSALVQRCARHLAKVPGGK